MAHGAVVDGREQKPEVMGADELLRMGGRKVDGDAERTIEIRAAAPRAHRAIAVLRHRRSAGGRRECGERADVERSQSVATGTARVHNRAVDRDWRALALEYRGASRRSPPGADRARRSRRGSLRSEPELKFPSVSSSMKFAASSRESVVPPMRLPSTAFETKGSRR